MTIAEAQRSQRLKELIKSLMVKDKDFAASIGIKPTYLSHLLNNHRKITFETAKKISERYTRVNHAWIMDGTGDMFSENKVINEVEPDEQLIDGEPSANAVQKLYDKVIERFKPIGLTGKQDITLRQACYRVIVENPGIPMASLVVGAGVYLRFIQAYPNLEIPGDYSPSGSNGG